MADFVHGWPYCYRCGRPICDLVPGWESGGEIALTFSAKPSHHSCPPKEAPLPFELQAPPYRIVARVCRICGALVIGLAGAEDAPHRYAGSQDLACTSGKFGPTVVIAEVPR